MFYEFVYESIMNITCTYLTRTASEISIHIPINGII